jgi:4-amino-4-deoxy-L-arabinose transferase-like glycosyltransferase
MPFAMARIPLTHLRLPVPLPSPWFWALVVLYVLLGLVGHDPWKGNDAVGFGIAWTIAQGGSWHVLNIAGQAVAEEGPLAFWFGALFIKALGGVLEPHDAARLSIGAWTALAIYGVYRASRVLDGEAAARMAVLALLACPGLLLRSHEIAAEPAHLAGWSLVLWGLARGSDLPRMPSLALLAAGFSISLLSRGWAATLPVGLAALAIAILDGQARAARLMAVVAAGAFALGVWWFAWTMPLSDHPQHAARHLAWNLAQFGLPGTAAASWYAKTLLWFAFPAWPVALWWVFRRRPLKLLDVHPVPLPQRLPLIALVVMLASLAWSARTGESVLLPLLPPLALLIAPGLAYLRRGQAGLIDWFGRITFSLVAALIWLGYAALMTGWPPRIAANFARREPGFVASIHWAALAIAVAASAAWILAMARSQRTPLRGITHWSYGTTLAWLLLMTLWLPWIDYGRSYRPVAQSMAASLGPRGAPGCVATRNLGLAERASLAYFARLKFGADAKECPWLLVQGPSGAAPRAPEGMRLAWEGNRPGDRDERFRLYRRSP